MGFEGGDGGLGGEKFCAFLGGLDWLDWVGLRLLIIIIWNGVFTCEMMGVPSVISDDDGY
jgi:hypothetical protein